MQQYDLHMTRYVRIQVNIIALHCSLPLLVYYLVTDELDIITIIETRLNYNDPNQISELDHLNKIIIVYIYLEEIINNVAELVLYTNLIM